MKLPGFVSSYNQQLKNIPTDIRNRINRRGGLTEELLLDLLINPPDHSISIADQPDVAKIIVYTEEEKEQNSKIGTELINEGKVAYCIMAGGAGTRIGEPKALLSHPESNLTLLSLKLSQASGTGPIWIVTSPTLKEKIKEHIDSLTDINKSRISILEQYESYRLNPDNSIIFNDGIPEVYPCGHGDIFPILAENENVKNFREKGGMYVCTVNVDNICADLSPEVVGHHHVSESKVTCEIVKKNPGDRGGILCNIFGDLQIVEEFRLHGTSADDYDWINTNSFTMNLDLKFGDLGVDWHRTKKQVGNRLIVQHERLIQEITAAYSTSYLYVERSNRFIPIKNKQDLQDAQHYFKRNLKFQ